MSAASPPHDFLRLLEPAVREAAGLARDLEGRVANNPKRRETSDVKQALTEADTRVQEVLLAALLQHFPDVSLAAEEDTESVERFPDVGDPRTRDRCVVIDPIDGTLNSYLEARGPYALMMGLVVEGRYEAGFVALPREGVLFAAARGAGAWSARAGGPLRPVVAEDRGNRILVTHGTPDPAHEWLRDQGLEVVPCCGGAAAVAPLLVGCRAGLRWSIGTRRGVSVRGRIGALVAREAGAVLRMEGDAPFPEDDATRAATLRVTAREEDQQLLDEALRVAGFAG
jgi:fructose-1,6-bisphosphatase/inositol monophosphatase family enzyme